MKKLLYIIIFIFILAILAGIGLFMSYTVIDEGEVVYIKTKLKPLARYEKGYYFFPAKILFYDAEAFITHKLKLEANELPIPIELTLAKLPHIESGQPYQIKYVLTVNYKLSPDYQISLIQNNKNKEFEDNFKNWLSRRDKDIVFDQLNPLLTKDKEIININDIFEKTTQTLYSEIQKKYTQGKIILTQSQISHSISEMPNLDIYRERLKTAKDLDKKFLAQKGESKRKEMIEQSKWENERMKIEKDIERLRMYGKLFNEYPEALNYLYLNKLSDKVQILITPKDTKGLFAPLLPKKNKYDKPLFVTPQLDKKEKTDKKRNQAESKVKEKQGPKNKSSELKLPKPKKPKEKPSDEDGQ